MRKIGILLENSKKENKEVLLQHGYIKCLTGAFQEFAKVVDNQEEAKKEIDFLHSIGEGVQIGIQVDGTYVPQYRSANPTPEEKTMAIELVKYEMGV